ncbi:MAG: hybrid sensor histidine kinase/response regulator [Microcoleaceae cyanobacterium]
MNNCQSSQPKIQILIVDDVLENLHLLNTILAEEGYKVRKVRSGKMALATIANNPPDLILLDINMPEMNGYEVCQTLKAQEEFCQIPIIFISALEEGMNKVKAFKVGGVDYITKPFQVEEVLARVENHLAINRLQKQLTEKNTLLEKSEAQERERSQQLEETLEQFKKAQIQLIQSEKMSSLGQMIAGIAHEVNNPINFISGNLHPTKEYSQDILHLLQLYQDAYPEPVTNIKETLEELELEFIQSDFPQSIEAMQVGIERIQDIVTSLLNFSRVDQLGTKVVDIHKGLDSSLRILQHRLKADGDLCQIQVIKEYESLPEVTCYPGQLNQVFMNLVSNAIDALEQRRISQCDRQNPPSLKLQTKLLSQEKPGVAVLISDNGSGMNETVQKQIFEPFFTTKEPGKGTGLGMSISHQIIVEQHQGELKCISTPRQGTMFAIEIPLKQL